MNNNNKKLIEKRQYVQGKISIDSLETKSDSTGKVHSNINGKHL